MCVTFSGGAKQTTMIDLKDGEVAEVLENKGYSILIGGLALKVSYGVLVRTHNKNCFFTEHDIKTSVDFKKVPVRILTSGESVTIVVP